MYVAIRFMFGSSACLWKQGCFRYFRKDSASSDKEVDKEDDKEENNSDSAKETIRIEDLVWNVEEGISDGERYVLFDYTNNTPYTIASLEITFKEKPDITEEEKIAFYAEIQEQLQASDEDIEELKEVPISMHTETMRVAEPGESVTNVNCYYYGGSFYLKDINHYHLVEPDIATIRYVDGDEIYTVYFDYSSGKYSAESETEIAYQWSKAELGNKIPKPDVKVVESSIDTEETFMFDAYGMSLEQFNAYVAECKDLGYTVDPGEHEGFYSADNAEGYNIYLYYDEDDYAMSGSVDAPDEELPEDDNDIESEQEDTNANEELVDGMRPEFKEAMDSYEAFYNEYCDILKKYTEDPTNTEVLADYTDMVAKSAEMLEKFEAWENDGLNDAELQYYLEVNNRITQKLLEVSE